MSKSIVLTVVAHPDDEILGVGATLAKHAAKGDAVHVVILATGTAPTAAADARKAADVLGFASLELFGLPDQRLDTLPILEITQRIERFAERIRPNVVYTHHPSDLNRDHRIACEASMTALRPVCDFAPDRILWFETPSSTEWSPPGLFAPSFTPNVFVDVTSTLEQKLAAMSCYATELRPAPHPRSLESLRARAAYWGQIANRPFAEAFALARALEA